jgi:hypothetical protein
MAAEGRSSFAVRLYALLLHLYPASFRREYGEAMLQLFNDQRRAARGAGGHAMLWFKVLRDLAQSVPAVHSNERRPGRQRGSMSLSAIAIWAVLVASVIAFFAFTVVIPNSVGHLPQTAPGEEAAVLAGSPPPTAAELARFRAIALSGIAVVTVLLAAAAFRFSRAQRSVLNGAAAFVAGALLTFVPLAMLPSVLLREGRLSVAAMSIMAIWPAAAAAWAVLTAMSRRKQRLDGL